MTVFEVFVSPKSSTDTHLFDIFVETCDRRVDESVGCRLMNGFTSAFLELRPPSMLIRAFSICLSGKLDTKESKRGYSLTMSKEFEYTLLVIISGMTYSSVLDCMNRIRTSKYRAIVAAPVSTVYMIIRDKKAVVRIDWEMLRAFNRW